MSQPVNPYVAGAPLHGERGFFGRQDTLDWVARELRNPATNALVLFGQRRIGKTTLLLQLERTLPAGAFLPVYFDLQDQAARPLGQVLADLADTVAERADLETPDPDSFDDRGRFFSHTFLPGLYTALSEARRPIFLFDEFDVLDQVAEAELPEEAAAKAFFPFLRRTMTEEARPAFVFVVGRRAEDLSLDFTSTFKASLVREIWVLDRESAEVLVRQAEANNTLRFTDRAVARILSLTSCHPYLTQLLCQRIWEQAYAKNTTAPPQIDVPEVEAAVPDALEAGDQALVWLWNGLGPAEKIYTAALAELADEGATIAEDQVIQVLSAHAARLRTREVELAPRDLVKRRVLEVAGEREYRFAVELFRRWVRRQKLLQEVKDELDRIEPMADRLYEIGRDYFNRRQWETAIRYFRDALVANPRHFRARLHLGEVLLELGQTDEAVAELERANELDREEARLPLARVLVAQAQARDKAGDEDGALAACEQALQVSPNERAAQELRAVIWTRRGNAALERNDLEAALAAYRKVGATEKIAQVGDAALKDDDLGAAMEAYREAGLPDKVAEIEQEIRRRHFALLLQELETLEREGRYQDALNLAHKSAEEYPAMLDWTSRVAEIEQEMRRRDLATGLQKLEAREQEKHYQDALYLVCKLAEEYPKERDWTSEIERLERKTHLADLYQRALEALQSDDRQTAQTLLVKVITFNPGYEEATRYLHLAVNGVDIAELQAQSEVAEKAKLRVTIQHTRLIITGFFIAGIMLGIALGVGGDRLYSASSPSPVPTLVSSPTSSTTVPATLAPTSTRTPTAEPTPTCVPLTPTEPPAPTFTPTVVPTVAPNSWGLHQVCAGQTLFEIAATYNTSVDHLAGINSISDPNQIAPGILLLVPWQMGSSEMPNFVRHCVTVGDTLYDLADRDSTNVDAIQAVNGLVDPNLIYPGQELNIPAGLVTTLRTNECVDFFVGKLNHPSGLDVYLRSSPALDALQASLVVANGTPLQVLGQNAGISGGPWYKVTVEVKAGGYRTGWLRSLWVGLEEDVSTEDIPLIEW